MKALAERAFRIMNDLLILFIALNIFNVIIQTIKNIATISCSKFPAALLNSFAYGFHTIVTVYMLCDLPLYLKALVVALCNLVGVYFVKWGEEKARKDKLWKVEATIPHRYSEALIKLAEEQEMSFNYVDIKKYCLFNFYCPTKAESDKVKELLQIYEAKYFVSESKKL